ncbi:cytosolic carboxypeptidase 2 isoform X2 [Sphaerodactylus townsendi]|uniref:cytosolic carboxypeptidase 2 isoform X2 n=1 Tax=Sphaerodactylus townsendi TaxID=933632 RepID=UPI002026EACB|nr:cytosolic carboxypeptidase 2 isoform X2 [Sphaerodactylus townsendi]
MCPADPAFEGQPFKDPYERFMYQHLQYYGYFKGDEQGLQNSSLPLENWRKSSQYTLKPSDFQKMLSSELHEDKKLLSSFITEQALLKSKQLMLDHPEDPGILRLREPRNLFSLPTCRDSLLAPLWPVECEVIQDQIHHIEWVPAEPEPFYQPTGNEIAPEIMGEDCGTIVYYIAPATKGTLFTGSRVGRSQEPIKSAAVSLTGPEDTKLLFESRFESGNLQKAVRVGMYEYELTLQTDLYTSKHTQWFYFQVQNTRNDVAYRFTIVNLMKSKSLYSMGMKPLLYSQKDAECNGIGWRREGSDIKYYKYNTKDGQTLYCLTWTVCFPHNHDTCYFAHFYPYTYSDLQHYLLTSVNDPLRSQYCKLRPLCNSLAGNTVYLLTITNPSKSAAAAAAKKAVVLSARVHPGETNSSWVMRGFLDFILSDSLDAQLLRDLFIFKVVPMLNPDGVIVGNYRCSLAGRDLNRNYRTVLKESFPCIWHTRAMIKRVLEEREILLYCDFHGHSRKNNVFMYGCNNKYASEQLLYERVFPLMLSKNVPDKFSFHSCKFKVQKNKEGTGRIVMWRMGIRNSYTMESTFSGSTLGNKSNSHFTYEDLKSLGYHVCDTLLDFCDPDRSKFQQCLTELQELLQQQIQSKLSELRCAQNTEGTWSDISLSDVESSTSGSNSSQSDDPPAHLFSVTNKEDYNEKKKKKKKKHLRTRKERNDLRQKYALSHTLKHQEDVAANSISPSPGKTLRLSRRSRRDRSSEKKNKQEKNIEDSVSSMQGENPVTIQEEHQAPSLDKQTIPVAQCGLKNQNPEPLIVTMIPPPPAQRPSHINSPIKQQPSLFYGQLKGEFPENQNKDTSFSSSFLPASGVRRHRSMLWNPDVSSVTLMLRRGLSLKSQITEDKKLLWNLTQSRSQVLPKQEFKWKPLKIDQLLLRVEKEHHHGKVRGARKESGWKHSSLEEGVAGPKSKAVLFP